jgi:hypothetical protein
MAVITSNHRFMAIGNGNGADMFTSGLEYNGSAISGYSGSAFYQAPQKVISGGNDISVTETGNTAVVSFTGNIPQPQPYSAGKNLTLTDNTFALNDTVVLGTQVSGGTFTQNSVTYNTTNGVQSVLGPSGLTAKKPFYSAEVTPSDVVVYTPSKTYSLTSMSPFTGIYKNSANFVGDGKTSRLDLNSSVWVSWSIGARQSDDEKAAVNFNGLSVTHTASGVGGGSIASTYGETYNIMFNDGEQYLKKAWLTKSGYSIHDYGNYGQGSAFYGPHSASFHDSLGQVYYNADSIRRWDAISQMNHDSNLSGDAINTPLGLASAVDLTRDGLERTAHITPGRIMLNDSTRTAWYYAAFASLESPTKSATLGAGYLELADSTHTAFREVTPASVDQWNSMSHIRVTAENEYIDISDQSWCLVSFDENISKAYIAGKRANGYLTINSGHWYMFGDAKKDNSIYTHLIASGNATTTYI